jgi:membrane dipeptidase
MSKISKDDAQRLGISEEAGDLLQQSIVIDLHIDPIIQKFLFDYDLREEHDLNWKPKKRRFAHSLIKTYGRLKGLHRPFFNHIDLPRMARGGYTAGVFGIHYWPIQSEKGWRAIKSQLSYFHQVIKENNNIILAKNPEDIRQAFKQGKLAGFTGVEGGHCLGKGGKMTQKTRIDRIEELFKTYGVRYLTLAHFSKNDAATPSTGLRSNDRDGLTDFGKSLIRKMNEVGMMVDVAHVNNQGVLDACQVSNKPVIVTHTGLKGKFSHSRNLSDEALKAVANTGGVVGIMVATNFLAKSNHNPTSRIVLEHIDHIINQVGEDHAAIGTDFDGWIFSIPQDMNDASDLPLLTQGMLDMGYLDKQIKKILGENFLRVWGDVLDI